MVTLRSADQRLFRSDNNFNLYVLIYMLMGSIGSYELVTHSKYGTASDLVESNDLQVHVRSWRPYAGQIRVFLARMISMIH